jgi:hypothetical protein
MQTITPGQYQAVAQAAASGSGSSNVIRGSTSSGCGSACDGHGLVDPAEVWLAAAPAVNSQQNTA